MADNEQQTTVADVDPVDEAMDSDSGIGTGSAQSTPSQSSLSTPSQSEMTTPVMSPTQLESALNFSFNPETVSGLQNLGINEDQNVRPSAMDTDSDQQNPQPPRPGSPSTPTETATKTETLTATESATKTATLTATKTATKTATHTATETTTKTATHTATKTATTTCPQMDRQGFYRPPDDGPKTIQIFVRNFRGQLTQFQISEDASVTDLRKMIHDKMGVPPSQQRLNYQGRELEDRQSLQSYGVRNLSEINLLGRLRGGIGRFFVRALRI